MGRTTVRGFPFGFYFYFYHYDHGLPQRTIPSVPGSLPPRTSLTTESTKQQTVG